MTKHPVITAPLMLCVYCQSIQGLNMRSRKLLKWTEPSGPNEYPTGFCIHESVAMMKYPDSHEPKKTSSAENQWPRRPSFFSPYRNRPRNADSRKNANTPSMARVCPITPPAYRENRAQFVPN